MEKEGQQRSATVLTISCEEEDCTSCEKDLDELPIFVNEFGKYSKVCVICGHVRNDDEPVAETIKVTSYQRSDKIEEVLISIF